MEESNRDKNEQLFFRFLSTNNDITILKDFVSLYPFILQDFNQTQDSQLYRCILKSGSLDIIKYIEHEILNNNNDIKIGTEELVLGFSSNNSLEVVKYLTEHPQFKFPTEEKQVNSFFMKILSKIPSIITSDEFSTMEEALIYLISLLKPEIQSSGYYEVSKRFRHWEVLKLEFCGGGRNNVNYQFVLVEIITNCSDVEYLDYLLTKTDAQVLIGSVKDKIISVVNHFPVLKYLVGKHREILDFPNLAFYITNQLRDLEMTKYLYEEDLVKKFPPSCFNSTYEIVRYLVVDIDQKGFTDSECEDGYHGEIRILELLEKYFDDPSKRDPTGSTFSNYSIVFCASGGYLDLLKYCFEVMHFKIIPYKALTKSAINNHLEVFKYLTNLLREQGKPVDVNGKLSYCDFVANDWFEIIINSRCSYKILTYIFENHIVKGQYFYFTNNLDKFSLDFIQYFSKEGCGLFGNPITSNSDRWKDINSVIQSNRIDILESLYSTPFRMDPIDAPFQTNPMKLVENFVYKFRFKLLRTIWG
eukprot:gene4554-5674_t